MTGKVEMILVVRDGGGGADGASPLPEGLDAMVVQANDTAHGEEIVRNIAVEAVLLDCRFPENALGFLKNMRENHDPSPPAILLIDEEDIETAKMFMKAGGTDFIIRSASSELLGLRIQAAITRLRGRLQAEEAKHGICRYTFRAYDDVTEMCDMFISAIVEHLNVDMVAVGSIAGDLYTVEYCYDRSGNLRAGESFPLQQTFCRAVAGTKEPVVIGDTRLRREWRGECADAFREVASYLGVPLTVQGEFFGALCVGTRQPREFSGSAVEVVTLFAQKMGAEMTRVAMEGEIRVARRHVMELQVIAAMNRMMAAVAHEMKQPLAAAEFDLSEAVERAGDSGAARGLVVAARTRIRDSLGIIRTMMKMHGGTERRAPVEVNVNGELDDALALFRRSAQSVEVVREYAADASICTSGNLGRIFINLIGNAFDAMKNSGRLRLATAVNGSHVETIIEDSGCGIPAADLSRIFDPGFTTKKAGQGAGFGLWIARQEAGRIGGTITVESRPGEMTRCTVRIPLRGEPESAGAGKYREDAGTASSGRIPAGSNIDTVMGYGKSACI